MGDMNCTIAKETTLSERLASIDDANMETFQVMRGIREKLKGSEPMGACCEGGPCPPAREKSIFERAEIAHKQAETIRFELREIFSSL